MKNIKDAIFSLYKIRFITAFLISILPIIIIGSYVDKGLGEYIRHQKQIHNMPPANSAHFKLFLRSVLWAEFNEITAPNPPKDSPLKTFHIFINKNYLLELDSNLPSSGKAQYYKAHMRIGSSTEKYDIALRYRGDNIFHWFYKQKSLRIKYKKGGIYNLERKFNLINPTSKAGVLECVNYQTARMAGLISPDCFPARVFINGEYFGVYTYVSQIEESTLRKHKRMPGSIYAGDQGDIDENGMSNLWSTPAHWEKKAARNAEQAANREDIEYFLEAVNNMDDLAYFQFFNKMVNKDAYYSFLALDVFFGSPHHDYHHNHKIYFDPYLGTFEPIAWDLRKWLSIPKKDLSLYPLLNRIKLNPVLEHERDLHLYNLMQSNALSLSAVKGRVLQLVENVYPDLEADKNRDTAIFLPDAGTFFTFVSIPYRMKEFDSTIKRDLNILDYRNRFLMDMQENAEFNYSFHKKSDNHYHLAFSVTGNTAIRLNLAEIFSDKVTIFQDTNFNAILNEGEPKLNTQENNILLYPGRKNIFRPGEASWPVIYGNIDLAPAPLAYSYIIASNDVMLKLEPIRAINALTGSVVTGTEASVNLQSDAESIHPWLLEKQPLTAVMLEGNIHVNKDLEFSEQTTVTIAPGTLFEVDSGKNIVFYGKITALGREDAPIVFKRKSADEAWGSLVIQGQTTSGSAFDYVEVTGGSTTKKNLIQYTAQFNIHDADNITIKNCIIGKNSVGDDSMHIAYSNVVMDGCIFHGARSDALDIDIATVTIKNSLFVNSGNDALDLMTTDAIVENCIFLDSGDKGISTGEWSTGLYRNNIFSGNLIGVEIKDKSEVKMKGGLFIDNTEWDINLYRKNKRYDLGGKLIGQRLYKSGTMKVKADDLSTYTLSDVISHPPTEISGSNKFIPTGSLTDWNETKKTLRELANQHD